MRCSIVKTVTISAALVLSVATAKAAVITNTYAVTGSNFSSTAASPYSSITESVTVTFTTGTSVSQQTSGISLNPSTITPTSPLAFTYNSVLDTLIIGGTASTVTTSDPNSTDFALIINNASSPANFSITSLSFSTGTGATFSATTTAKAAVAAVPEPVSMALLGTAAAAFAFTRRRRPG